MALISYSDYQNQKENKNNYSGESKNFKVNYFGLKKDKEEAIVRFCYNSPEEFDLFTVHHIPVNGKTRCINCLNTPYQDNDCPLCKKAKSKRSFFIRMIQYTKDENNNLKIQAKIWERSEVYLDKIANLFKEYGNISDCVFKIRRNGNQGDPKTTYDIMLANPLIYKPELYVKDFSAFDNFKFSDFFVQSKTREEMESLLDVESNQNKKENNTQTFYSEANLENKQNFTSNNNQDNFQNNNQDINSNTPRRTYSF